jgi:cytochrome c553
MSVLAARLLTVLLCSVMPLVSAAEAFDHKKADAEFRAALRLTPDERRGERIFATCSACHGIDGAGSPEGPAPVVAGQYYSVLLRQLVDYRHAARWDIRMEHVARMQMLATPQDLVDIAAFIAKLQPARAPVVGNGEHLQRGVHSYFERCQVCHGATGQGDGERRIARLAGQHPEYLQRQFVDVLEGRRPRLTDSHAAAMQGLEVADIEGIADYLSRTRRDRITAQ